jgi:hypothetical protein
MAFGVVAAAIVAACATTGAATADSPAPVVERGTTSTPAPAAHAAPARGHEPAWVYHKGTFYWPGDYSFAAKPFYADGAGGGVSGNKPIRVEVTSPWGGFLPFARNWDFDSRPYAFLTFAFKPTVANQTAQVFFVKVGDIPVGVVVNPFNGQYGPAPRVGEWGTYKIPLSDLGVLGKSIYKFAIQDQTGLPHNVFFLDDIGFLPPDP